MTNTPTRMTPFHNLIAHIHAGSEVRVGEWTINKATPVTESTAIDHHWFHAEVTHHNQNNGHPFVAAIALRPSHQENLAGLLVDLTVEVKKMEQTHTGLPFSTPIGTAKPTTTQKVLLAR